MLSVDIYKHRVAFTASDKTCDVCSWGIELKSSLQDSCSGILSHS